MLVLTQRSTGTPSTTGFEFPAPHCPNRISHEGSAGSGFGNLDVHNAAIAAKQNFEFDVPLGTVHQCHARVLRVYAHDRHGFAFDRVNSRHRLRGWVAQAELAFKKLWHRGRRQG